MTHIGFCSRRRRSSNVTFGNPTMQELCNGRRRDAPGSGIPKGFQRCRRSTSPTSRTIRCPRSNKNLHSLRRRFHFDTQQAWEINECEPDLRAAFAHIRQFQFDLYQTLLSESACLFVECGVLLATPIAGIRNPEIAHFQPQTGEPLRNVVSINHCHDHTPRLLRAQCNERLRQWLSLPLGIRTCFASFANPWRSSRLSSSLPQSSQRTATKNAKPNPRTIALRPLRILGVLREIGRASCRERV